MRLNVYNYYKCIIMYTDYILHLAEDTKHYMNPLNQSYRLNKGSFGEPDRYIGESI